MAAAMCRKEKGQFRRLDFSLSNRLCKLYVNQPLTL